MKSTEMPTEEDSSYPKFAVNFRGATSSIGHDSD